jgi:hypothetical protein
MNLKLAICTLIGLLASAAYAGTSAPRVVDVRDIENPARTPFVVEGTVIFEGSGSIVTVDLGEVPAGKRAVIEFISMLCNMIPPDTISFVLFNFPHGNEFSHHFLPISKQGDPGTSLFQNWVAGQLVQIYADAGKISVEVGRSFLNPNQSGCTVNISGHTIDVTHE